jgi:hypothetical protein
MFCYLTKIPPPLGAIVIFSQKHYSTVVVEPLPNSNLKVTTYRAALRQLLVLWALQTILKTIPSNFFFSPLSEMLLLYLFDSSKYILITYKAPYITKSK